MFELDVSVEDQSGALGLVAGIRAKIPTLTAIGINDTVNQAQTEIQKSLPADFTLRHASFIVNTIYRKPGQDFASPTNLAGAVRVNPDRDFLAKFEVDPVKVAHGASPLTVPIMRLGAPAIIVQRGDPLNAHRILALIASQGGKNVGPFRKRGAKKAMQESFFLMQSKSGKTLIVQRVGVSIRTLYSLVHEVPITSHRLHFEEIAERVALERFEPNFTRAFEVATASL